jgi:threonylcarbamoyladenosine tRNA methylthiotransferase CDKAL1
MMGQLVEYGYKLVEDPTEADCILINSCTVKNPSQESLMRMVFDSKKIKKPVVVAGCVPQGDNFIEGLHDVSIIGVTQIDRVVEVVEETLKGNSVQLLKKKDLPELDMPKIRKNRHIEM